MKFLKYILFISLFITSNLFSQNRKLKAYLDEKQYYAPEIGNYIEIQLQFVGYSLNYKENSSKNLQAEIGVIMKITQNDSLIANDGYRLQSPEMKDSVIEDFYDLKRFALKPGNYIFTIELQDLISNDQSLIAKKELIIEDLSNRVTISDIEIAESATKGDEGSVFYKSGYNIVPRLSNYFPKELSFLPVYIEIYNTNTLNQDAFGLKQKIINTFTDEEQLSYTHITKLSPAEVVPFARSIDIQNLPTGKYILNYSIISKDMVEICTKSYEFERTNDDEINFDPDNIVLNPAFQESIHKDSVMFYLASLIPISNPAEIKNLLTIFKSKNEENARKIIQGFWAKSASTNPYESWIRYKTQVDFIESIYRNNFQAGYETDRGRVYLQYGPPTSTIQRETTPNEYPYEIWQYNKIGRFSNKRFIFYNPDLVSTSYRLLHSDMIGEVKNNGWQQVLQSRNSPHGTVDDPNQNVNKSFGDSDYYFKQY